jgi:hypothetical protein
MPADETAAAAALSSPRQQDKFLTTATSSRRPSCSRQSEDGQARPGWRYMRVARTAVAGEGCSGGARFRWQSVQATIGRFASALLPHNGESSTRTGDSDEVSGMADSHGAHAGPGRALTPTRRFASVSLRLRAALREATDGNHRDSEPGLR